MADSNVQHTLALIKPDAVKSGKAESIISIIQENGFEVVAKRRIQLTEKDAREFYKEHDGKPFFPRLLEFITSGTTVALALRKANAVADWRQLMGPTNVLTARSTAPDSIRARFGTDGTMNATHGSDSAQSAEREVGFFFPDVAESAAKEKAISVPEELLVEEKTLALIKPDAVAAGNATEIMQLIKMAGFALVAKRKLQLSREQAEAFYAEHEGKSFFPTLVDFMTSGPIYALMLAKPGAVKAWRALMGPTNVFKARQTAPSSLRALFGTDGTRNATHGSDSALSATRELKFFFPMLPEAALTVREAETSTSGADEVSVQKTFAIIKPDAVRAGRYNEIMQLIARAGFIVSKKEMLQLTRERAEDFYAEHKGKDFFPGLVEYMCSGPIYALVLAKDNAILAWRAMMGPTNVHKAREEAPGSLRALYGIDGTQNACHGSDSVASAQREIKFFFPELIVDNQIQTPEQSEKYIVEVLQPTILKGLTALVKEKPSSEKYEAITWLAHWLLKNNPNKAKVFAPDQWVPPADEEDDEIEAIERAREAAERRAEEAARAAAEAEAAERAQYDPGTAEVTGAEVEVVGLGDTAEDVDAMNNAATKVQAGWRGHQARKEVERMKVTAA